MIESDVYVVEDLLPEKTRYRDDGCDLAPYCLNCPFAKCRYDEEGSRRQVVNEIRDKEIVRARFVQGIGIGELAERYGVSKRTVHRILRRNYR